MFFDVANIEDLLNTFLCNLTDSKSMDAMFLPIQFENRTTENLFGTDSDPKAVYAVIGTTRRLRLSLCRYNAGRPFSLSCMSATAPPVNSLRTRTVSRWSCSESRTNSCWVSASCCTDSDRSSRERETVSNKMLVGLTWRWKRDQRRGRRSGGRLSLFLDAVVSLVILCWFCSPSGRRRLISLVIVRVSKFSFGILIKEEEKKAWHREEQKKMPNEQPKMTPVQHSVVFMHLMGICITPTAIVPPMRRQDVMRVWGGGGEEVGKAQCRKKHRQFGTREESRIVEKQQHAGVGAWREEGGMNSPFLEIWMRAPVSSWYSTSVFPPFPKMAPTRFSGTAISTTSFAPSPSFSAANKEEAISGDEAFR
ncbi:hypothetical protein EYF80_013122 [Liparis tanakae]|uniref:Uncharacterized protein n=1 Tax=Liparis tanakae TaxID=230148 RepID=A0A4Z2IFI7_9TELE|nr:hypothetical protein EYF80_013122 [Liparis tanakae]